MVALFWNSRGKYGEREHPELSVKKLVVNLNVYVIFLY